MAKILVVDDEPHLAETVCLLLKARGHDVELAATGEDAIARCQAQVFDVLILDIVLPGISGTQVFQRVHQIAPSTVIVFLTAHGSIRAAVDAIRNGGFDYLTKPFDNDELVLTIQRGLERRQLQERVHELEQDLSARTTFVGIVGRSPAIRDALRRLARVATTNVIVLLAGESGTGKELAARSVHRQSDRATGPFVAVNCGAVPPTLSEAEMFGHERGAFTDAKGQRPGWFEQARGGTLFLDEVGDLPLDLQVKLLRVLEEGEVRRVGGSKPIPVDVRVIAASNRALDADVKAGRFRDDLFWRLNVFAVEMPPLRDRREDLPLLVEHLLERVNAECRTQVTGLSVAVEDRFAHHAWSGNVRELVNVLKHGAIMSDGPTIELQHLPDYLANPAFTPEAEPSPPSARGETLAQRLESVLAATEQQLVEAALERCRGNQTAAAAALGITRRTLYSKLRRYRP
jgi:two-component system response regulator AtoC